MFEKQIKWLESNHLNHAAIAIGLFYPMILLSELHGGTAYNAAFMWSFGYYIREVTQAARYGLFGSLAPWKWSFHDWVQTVYVVIGTYTVAGVICWQ